MNRIEAEAIVNARRQQEGRNYEKDHSMDECVFRLTKEQCDSTVKQESPQPKVSEAS